MRKPTHAGKDSLLEHRFDFLIGGGLVLFVRGLWLAARGGGSTPRWMLACEIATSGSAVVAGLIASRLHLTASEHSFRQRAAQLSVTAGSIAVVMHTVRLVIYLRSRNPGASASNAR